MAEHIVIIGSYADSLVNFRGDLIVDLVSRGYRVTAMAPDATVDQKRRVEELGADFVSYSVARNSLSIFDDLSTYWQLRRLLCRLKPNLVLCYTIKPVIWGGLAGWSYPAARYFAMISGLGFAFQGHSFRRLLLRKLVCGLYKLALKRAVKVFFQNTESKELFVDLGLIRESQAVLIPGSGVNLTRFAAKPVPEVPLTFLMLSRLIGEKGVRLYAAAASALKQEHPELQFLLAGPFDPSPDGITREEVASWQSEGSIEYLGVLSDVRDTIARCSVYVLPSSYLEGVPRSILEALAIGRPILTTNTPGCRTTVTEGKNGFLIEPGSKSQLIDRMRWFVEHRPQINEMANESRRIAETAFSVQHVNQLIVEQFEIGPKGA